MTVDDDTGVSQLTALNGVGPALAKKLERLGIFVVEDLLFLLPLRYEDRTQLVKLGHSGSGQPLSRDRRSAALGNRLSGSAQSPRETQ